LIELGDLALEGDWLFVRAGQLQSAQQVLAGGLRSGCVPPQHADRELAVRVVSGSQITLYRQLTPLLGVAHVDRLGDLEQVLGVAVDEMRLVG
jgi:hypothetical protein